MSLIIVDLLSGSLSHILSFALTMFTIELLRPWLKMNKVLLIISIIGSIVFLGWLFYDTHYFEKIGIVGFWIGFSLGIISGLSKLFSRRKRWNDIHKE